MLLVDSWEDVPEFMRCDEVRRYYDILYARRRQLAVKRLFDIVAAIILLVILAVPMAVIAVMIRIDTPGRAIFCQERVTSYGRRFKIHKFRTMTQSSSRMGSLVTAEGDSRITKMGMHLRNRRLDELPQLFDILAGNMSFVGTRPEVPKYVDSYNKEMLATLLLPAGVTSEASIRFKDESKLLAGTDDIDRIYIEVVLPEKMKYNLEGIKRFSILNDIRIMIRTVIDVR